MRGRIIVNQIKIAIGLFIILILASIAGTITTVDIYHSWWFITILALIGVNIVLCSFSRKKRADYFLIHIGILVILLGAMIGSLAGFKEYLEVDEGQTVFLSQAKLGVRLEKFEIDYYPNSQTPRQYRSTLTIMEKGRSVLTKTIEVNHPLSYKGIRFYQSSYGHGKIKAATINISKAMNSSGENITLCVGEETTSLGLGLRIKLIQFLPDFAMIGTMTYSRSNELTNPAAKLMVYDKNGLISTRWVFGRFPDFHFQSSEGLRFRLIGIESSYYSGLQAVKDPGVPLVFLGFCLLPLGLIKSLWRRRNG